MCIYFKIRMPAILLPSITAMVQNFGFDAIPKYQRHSLQTNVHKSVFILNNFKTMILLNLSLHWISSNTETHRQ